MPLIRIDYNDNLFTEKSYEDFTKYLLEESMRIFNTDADHISVFSTPYGPYDLSTSIAEIEYRAGKGEFEDDKLSPEEKQADFLAQLSAAVRAYKSENEINYPIILTLTIENWKFDWIA